jgi:3-deoxy-D-manno-octulosonate 8-phosphate phosphatase KdsC-like HAD superfamily phosphatase
VVTGVLTRGLTLVRHLNHSANSFFVLDIFEIRSHKLFASRVAWITGANYCCPTIALVILEIESCFLPSLTWTSILLFCASCCHLDDRCLPLCSAIG